MATRHHFVDEAGDTTLFGRHGKVLVGTDQTSLFFIVGRLEVDDLPALEADVTALRAQLIADPLLRAIPSMKPGAGKTASFFHAKDDVPEVRHAVFKLLPQHDLRLSAVVKENTTCWPTCAATKQPTPSTVTRRTGTRFMTT